MKRHTHSSSGVLQNCLPGVTVSDVATHPYSEPQGYQSFQVDHQDRMSDRLISKDDDNNWLEGYRHRHSTSRYWFFLALTLLVFPLRPWFRPTLLENENRQKILHFLAELNEVLEGSVILQSPKPKFVQAARTWQEGQLLHPPLAVIQAQSQHDVELAVPILSGLARDYDLQFRVASGGYSPAGYSSVPNGVVLNLAGLTNLGRVTNATVVVEPGVRVQEFLQHVLDQQGHAGVVADAARISMVGFVLSGGYGHWSRRYGLAIDNVVRFKIVLTNGQVQNVRPGDDLFWALQGGGTGNFGVVTEMEYRVFPCDDMKLAATIQLPLSHATSFLQRLGEEETKISSDVAVRVHGWEDDLAMANSPRLGHPSVDSTIQGNATTTLSLYWMGDSDPEKQTGMDYLEQHIVSLLPNETARVHYYYISWTAMTRAKEQPATWTSVFGAQSWNGFLWPENNTPQVWQDIQDSLSVVAQYCQYVAPQIDLWGGAIAQVPSNATAFVHRQALYFIGLEVIIPNGTQEVWDQEAALVNAIWPSIAQYLRGSFVSYPMASLTSDEYPQAYWGTETLQRLIQIKEQHDPFHTLRYEQSIPIPNQTHHR